MPTTAKAAAVTALAFAVIALEALVAGRRALRGLATVRTRSGRVYTVAQAPTREQERAAAELLDTLYEATQQLVNSIGEGTEGASDFADGISRLRAQAPHIEFTQLVPERGAPVAINFGKGQSIHLCLTDPRTGDLIQDLNPLMSVVVHEVAHIMDPGVSETTESGHSRHSETFKRGEAFLMKHASRRGLVSPDGAVGSSYCGIRIPDAASAP